MLSELEGSGWTMAEPPEPTDGNSVVARVNGKPIKAGLLVEKKSDTSDEFHAVYRSGKYDLDVKVDFIGGHGQVRVEEASGYDN